MSGPRLAITRALYRIAYRLIALLARTGRRGRGVKCVLTHRSEVLLVRHAYGPRQLWLLPGGGARRGEDAHAVAAREMGEELAVHGLSWAELARVALRLEHMSAELACLHAELSDPTVRIDPVEIEEARWFALGALPEPLGIDVRELILTMGLGDRVLEGTTGERDIREERG